MAFPEYLHSVHHDGSSRYVRRPAGRDLLRFGDEVTLRLRTAQGAPIQRILLRMAPDGEQQFIEMIPGDDLPPCRWWEATIKLVMPVVNYRFLLFTSDGAFWYNANGPYRGIPVDGNDFRLLTGYRAPTWLRDTVFYQVFPDRFADGDPQSNVKDGEIQYWGIASSSRKWGEPPTRNSRPAMVEFYGGDLKGVEDKLDYLDNLGVNAVYLNPIFTAFSNHRYDVIDYENVDPHLGGNQALVSLREALDRRGMRLILDIVPNHCGVMHPWFQSALADPNAPTAEYFTFLRHPEDYLCWLGVRGLPKLNYRSEKLRKVMYQAPDSIFKRWLNPPYRIDGWRLDVANMLARQGPDQLGQEIGHGIRKAVKEDHPDAYLLGENFFDASHQLQGDTWDAVMNYSGFSKPLWYWLAGFNVNQHGWSERAKSSVRWPGEAVTETWQSFTAAIPWEIARQQFNLLGSHDTERILSRVGGSLPLAKLAAAVLLTYPGVPCVYYGDEVGQGADPMATSRDCMPWDPQQWNEDMRTTYRELIRLRRTSPALIDGGFQVLYVEDDLIIYQRDTDEEIIIVCANRGPKEHAGFNLNVARGGAADRLKFTELFSGIESMVGSGLLPLPQIPVGAQVWQTKWR